MKIQIDCASCIIYRGLQQIVEATDDQKLRFKAMRGLFQFLATEFKATATPAWLGTMRDRILKRLTGNPDPYAEGKKLSNQKALEMLPIAERIVYDEEKPEKRFRKACLCAIVGNIMEFDIPGHKFRYGDLKELIQNAEKDLAIDEIDRAYALAKKSRRTLFLTDNAGEIAFDTLLARELKNVSAHVTVVVKGGPVLNDATMEDAEFVGMDKVVDAVISTGTDAVGLQLDECSEEFLEAYGAAEFVVAKGMGYAETLTEIDLKVPHLLLLRTKCDPIARYFNVKRDKNVAKILP